MSSKRFAPLDVLQREYPSFLPMSKRMLPYSQLLTNASFRYTKKYLNVRCLSGASLPPKSSSKDTPFDRSAKVQAMIGHNFPDFIEWWSRKNFKRVGNGLIAASVVCAIGGATTLSTFSMMPAAVLGSLTMGYWYVGLQDMQQKSHAIRRNYPVIGNLRYVLETVRTSSC
jgi:hypothetical protein